MKTNENIRANRSIRKALLLGSLVLISFTNVIIFSDDGIAPLTPFLLITPFLLYCLVFRNGFPIKVLDIGAGLLLIAFFILSGFINYERTRWSSAAYSVIFTIFFIFVMTYKKLVTRNALRNVSKFIVYAYFINVLLAHLFYYCTDYFFSLNWLLQGTPDLHTGAMRFQGFSSEPSYAAFVVMISLFVFLKLAKREKNDVVFTLFLISIYLLISFKSVYGYILFSLNIFVLIFRKFTIKTFFTLFLLMILIFILALLTQVDLTNDLRFIKLMRFLGSGDLSVDNLNGLDSSAWLRVAPLAAYMTSLNFLDINVYVGSGASSSSKYFLTIFPDVVDVTSQSHFNGSIRLGFLPAFLYDYGLTGVLLVFFIVWRRAFNSLLSFNFAFFLLLIFNANLNTQLFWFVWVMLFLLNSLDSQN